MADVTSPRAAAEAHLAGLPLWSGTPEFVPIEDGRTNCNFRVTDAKGTWFARVGVDLPHHFIFREHERRAALLASDLGVAPRIVYAENGALVTEFIEGRGLVIADGQDEATLMRTLNRRCAAFERTLRDCGFIQITRTQEGPVGQVMARTYAVMPYGSAQDLADKMRANGIYIGAEPGNRILLNPLMVAPAQVKTVCETLTTCMQQIKEEL